MPRAQAWPHAAPSIKLSAAGKSSSSHCPGIIIHGSGKQGSALLSGFSHLTLFQGCKPHSCSELGVTTTAWSLWGGFGAHPPGEQPEQGISMCSHRERGDGSVPACPSARTGSSGWGNLLLPKNTTRKPKRGQFPAPSWTKSALQHLVTSKVLPRALFPYLKRNHFAS